MNTKISTRIVLLCLSCILSIETFSQGNFPITADIGYVATINEVKTHFAVPGATPGSPGDPYSYQKASGSYSIFYANDNESGAIKRPIIIAEGFDPTDLFTPNGVIALLNGDPASSADNLANALRAQGFDLIVLDYDDGGQLIQRNAFLLIKLIQEINAIKTSECPIILAGYSMGGIVSRYALNYMEANALPHNVGLFFSFDSPQKGANVPLGMQDMVDWLDNNVATYGLSVDIQHQVRSIHSYAAQQMLMYHTDYIVGDNVSINPAFTFFYNQMKGLVGGDGYPSNCKKIAASLGDWTGLGQAYKNNANQWVDHTGGILATNPLAFSFTGANNSPFIGYALVGQAAPLPYNITVPFSGLPFGVMYISVASAIFSGNHQTGYHNAPIPADVMPGSFSPIFQEVATSLNGAGVNSNVRMANGCFIPTVSALDFNTNNWYHNISTDPNRLSKTPFSSIFAAPGNFDHKLPLANHFALADWILNEVNTYSATIAFCENPALPVRLMRFAAKKEGEITVLNWETTSDINFDHFSVERSRDGKQWFSIKKISTDTGKQSSGSYFSADKNPLNGDNFYRLKMVDQDGSYGYSGIKKLSFEISKTILYPNPLDRDGKLKVINGNKKIVNVGIYNQQGRRVFHAETSVADMDVKDLPGGQYILKIRYDDGSVNSQVFVKQ